MATYELRLDANAGNLMEQIEALQGIGAVELIFTIESETRRKAIKETTEVIDEFNATYRGTYTSPQMIETINSMKLVRKQK